MKLIIENWRRFLKEEFPDEDNWQQGRDSDYSLGKDQEGEPTYGKLFLILDNEEDLKIKYPSVGPSNHGLVSHAIKHSIELGVDLKPAFKKFQNYVQQKLQNGEFLYVKTEKGNFKINQKIIDLVKQFDALDRKQFSQKRDEIKMEIQRITGMFQTGLDIMFITYKDTIVQRIQNLKFSYMLTCYDFYHDKGGYQALEVLPFFEPQIIKDYNDRVNQIINDNPNKFIQSEVKPGLEVLVTADRFVIIKQDGKIATAMKPKRPKTLEDYLTEGIDCV